MAGFREFLPVHFRQRGRRLIYPAFGGIEILRALRSTKRQRVLLACVPRLFVCAIHLLAGASPSLIDCAGVGGESQFVESDGILLLLFHVEEEQRVFRDFIVA